MTLHQYGEFLLGNRIDFKNKKDLGGTILWELYRLATQGTGELSHGNTQKYSDAAQEFSKKAVDFLNTQ